MAYISFKPTDYFNTKLYTGNASTNAITGVGFQPDAVVTKSRNATYDWMQYDSVRGATKEIRWNGNWAEATGANLLQSFNSDGFTLGSTDTSNNSGTTFVSYNWKAGTTSGISGGTITPSSYSINTTSKFGIYKWSGTGSAGTIAHGLGKVPQMILLKRLDTTYSWFGYFDKLGSSKNLSINLTNAAGNAGAGIWNSTSATNTVFSVGNDDGVNLGSGTYVAYVWCNVAGSSSIGEYTGNGNVDGTFVYTGFRPAFLMMKCSSATENWYIFNNKSAGYNFANYSIKANSTDAEATSTYLELMSNGFKIRNAAGDINANSAKFVYMAFAEQPIVGSNGTAGVAR